MAGIFGGSSFGFAAAGRRRARSRCESSSRAAQTRDSRASERCREPFAGDARGQAFGVFGWDGFGMGAGVALRPRHGRKTCLAKFLARDSHS